MTLYLSKTTGNKFNAEYPDKTEINYKTFKDAVSKDHVMCEFKGGHRSKANWISADGLYGDIDNTGVIKLSIAEFKKTFKDYSYYLATSKSHGKPKKDFPAAERYHVYFPTERYTDAKLFERLLEKLVVKYPFFDPASSDIAHFLFGNPNSIVSMNEGRSIVSSLVDVEIPKKDSNINRLDKISDADELIEGEGRDPELYAFCCHWARKIRELGKTGDTLESDLIHIAEVRNLRFQPPLSEAVMLKKVEQALKATEGDVIQKPYVPEIGPRVYTLSEILTMSIPPMTWVIPNLIPAGLTLLGGSPKIGKSSLCLGLAVAIAEGLDPLGNPAYRADKPLEVLYVALEDGPRRIRDKALRIGYKGTDKLKIVFECPSAGAQNLLENWMLRYPNTKLVIIDTLQKVRETGVDTNEYGATYSDAAKWKDFADRHDIAVIATHHTNKGQREDWVDNLMGSKGTSAAADTIMVIDRKRTKNIGIIRFTGRDIEEQSIEATFEDEQWEYGGPFVEKSETAKAPEREKILDWLKSQKIGKTKAEIMTGTGKTRAAVSVAIEDAGDLIVSEGERKNKKYSIKQEDG